MEQLYIEGHESSQRGQIKDLNRQNNQRLNSEQVNTLE